MAEAGILHARLKTRGATLAEFAAENPVLLDRELAIVTDSGVLQGGVMVYKMKMGPGQWSLLPFVSLGAAGLSEAEVNGLIGAAMSALGTAAAADTGLAEGNVVRLVTDGKLPASTLPALAITDVFPVANELDMLALVCQQGDVAIRSDLNKSYILREAPASSLGNWSELLTPTDAVLAVAGLTGSVGAGDLKAALGLDQVPNTAVDATSGMIEVAKNKSYVLMYKTAFPGTILSLQVVCDSGGTVTAAVKINGTAVTGISAVSVSSTPATATATAANTYAAGATVEITLSANASAKNVRWTLTMIRSL